MKRLILSIAAVVVLSSAIVGCGTTAQQRAYDTIYSLEVATTGGYDVYCSQVIKGTVRTNEMPRVSKAYNIFQGGMLVALDAVQHNTNALAPASLVVESQDVLNLISTATKGTP